MAAAQQPNASRRSRLQQVSRASSKRPPELLLWYWAFSLFPHGRWARIAFIQPGIGLVMAPFGVLAGVFRWWSLSLADGLIIAAIGILIVTISYLISRVYHTEYPGRFNARLEEYVARRVSRLSKDDFIPQYKTRDYAHTDSIRALNRRVRGAIRVEKERLVQRERTSDVAVCGVLVIGPRHTNKTGALWDAMTHELSGWTFVRWPHHMDHPANLALRLGHRIVLWIDDLHDYAHVGEAAALAQFIQQVRENGRQLIVLSSCREEQVLQEAERFFRPLMNELQRVKANDQLPQTEQHDELQQTYETLSPGQKSVLITMDWLKSLHVSTYPEAVLKVFSSLFPRADVNLEDTNRSQDSSWEATITGLSGQAKFVHVDQLADPQTYLSSETYNFVDWVRYNLLNRLPRPHIVVEPINAHFLDLEGSRTENVRAITTTLERQPELVIRVLANDLVAAETLILLGDAYMNHLGEYIDNAGDLAIACYAGALNQLDTRDFPKLFPGAWAAALVGKGTAELRVGKVRAADTDFRRITEPSTQIELEAPVPAMLRARAWHGQGDVIAAQIPGDEATQRLQDAAMYYQKAAEQLVTDDPLRSEAILDRANILYEIAHGAMERYEQSLSTIRTQPPLTQIGDAQRAYRDSQLLYSQATSPAAWAEIQRRQGELFLMEARVLLPADMSWPRISAASAPVVTDLRANLERALETAKKARDCFIAARNVFAPSYLPRSWSQTQVGLVHALLIVARIVGARDAKQADALYSECLKTTETTAQKVYTPAEAPLDWMDLQLLRAEAEIGLGALDDANALAQYEHAGKILRKADRFLGDYVRLPENPMSDRITAQRAVMERLFEKVR